MRTLVFTSALCALCAAACGGSDPPAQDPSSVSAPMITSPREAMPAQGASNAMPPSPPANANPDSAGSIAPSTAPSTPANATNSPPSHADATVANNPGSADQTRNADNTKINDRDRHASALTPMSQGNSGDETKISAAIRRGLMGDKSLSFTAKNVKVITTGTKVTLRGPVHSDQEKATIEALAKQTAGVSEVDNQLEVKK